MKTEFHKAIETFTADAKTLAQKYFVSPEIFDQERERIFARNWVFLGHESELAGPGDYFLTEIAGESLIVTRDQISTIHVFYNVCRHRGSRLCQEPRGHANAIQCPYHAWTYALDGELIGAPHMEPQFDKTDYPLHSAKSGVWEGLIFANLGDAAGTLAEWFAPVSGKFSDWNMSRLRAGRRIEYDVAANWKLVFQNYSECYHCPGVHPELCKLSPFDSAENDLCQGPFLGGFMSVNRGRSLTKSGNACALSINNANPERIFYYSIFPNALLSLHPDYVMVHRLLPQSPNRTLISCEWFFRLEAFGQENFNPEDAIEFWDKVNRQDWHVCELSQQGISSRAYEAGPYSPRESIPAAWDEYYLRAMDA